MTGRTAQAPDVAYATGSGFVQHISGARWSASDCERVRQYLITQIGNPSRSALSVEHNQMRLDELDAAMAASFSETQQKDVA